MEMRNIAVSFVIFGIAVTLLAGGYQGIKKGYNITDTYTNNGMNVMEAIDNLTIVTTVNKLSYDAAKPLLSNSSMPTGNLLDLTGTYLGIGLGALKIIGGIMILPFQIVQIGLTFYPIPTIITTGLLTILTVYVSFILISAYLNRRI